MIQRFRKKPVVVEAMQFTDETKNQCHAWVSCTREADVYNGSPVLKIRTLEGVMTACLGDWIIRGVVGEFYPCRKDIFEATYELAEDGVPDGDPASR